MNHTTPPLWASSPSSPMKAVCFPEWTSHYQIKIDPAFGGTLLICLEPVGRNRRLQWATRDACRDVGSQMNRRASTGWPSFGV
jgi:hypothetical protein